MKSTMHIYVEHKGDVQEDDVCDVQEDGVGNVQEDEVVDVHTNDVVDGLLFDDSEDERAAKLDNCFKDRGVSGGVKVKAKKHKITPKKLPTVVDNAGSSSGVDNEMDVNYASEELGGSDPGASDE
ncbi:unnamed protein product [Vicia faba]|uniref:Uncharacterized protein n=1 Tax=Vicia faba TaxID=3906 RepID=A0AAV1B3N8_VICFA|nr:unnamed protein product [Vicia faba]